MKISIKYIVLAILILFIAAFVGGGLVGLKKGKNSLNATIDSLNAKISYYTVVIDGSNSYIAEKEQEITTLRRAIRNGDIEKEELRKLNIKHLSEITRLKLRIDTLIQNISHTGAMVRVDTVIVEGRKENALLLPFSFSQQDEYLDLYGTFNLKGDLAIDLSLDAPVDLWVDAGNKRNPPKAIVTSKSTYINVLSIESIRVDMPKPKKYGIGLQIGWGLTKELKTSPYIGVGLSYNLIRF